MQVSIVKISNLDVNQLKKIALHTFRQSYEHLNDPANFQDYINRAFRLDKLLEEIQSEDSFFYFIKSGNNLGGYLKLNIGSNQSEEHGEEYLEIERIYLDLIYQRKGIGKQMIEFAIKKAKELQKTKIWLGVWDKNPQAIQFYKKMGFHKTGSHIFKFGNEDQIDILMEKNVS